MKEAILLWAADKLLRWGISIARRKLGKKPACERQRQDDKLRGLQGEIEKLLKEGLHGNEDT